MSCCSLDRHARQHGSEGARRTWRWAEVEDCLKLGYEAPLLGRQEVDLRSAGSQPRSWWSRADWSAARTWELPANASAAAGRTGRSQDAATTSSSCAVVLQALVMLGLPCRSWHLTSPDFLHCLTCMRSFRLPVTTATRKGILTTRNRVSTPDSSDCLSSSWHSCAQLDA